MKGYRNAEILVERITYGAAGVATTREFISMAASTGAQCMTCISSTTASPAVSRPARDLVERLLGDSRHVRSLGRQAGHDQHERTLVGRSPEDFTEEDHRVGGVSERGEARLVERGQ